MMESFCLKIHPNNEHLPHFVKILRFLKCSVLHDHSLKCSSFGLTAPFAMQENQSDLEEEMALAERDKETLNALQRSENDFILTALDAPINDSDKLFFLDGPGGSRKIYLFTILLRYCRGKQISVLSAATTIYEKNTVFLDCQFICYERSKNENHFAVRKC